MPFFKPKDGPGKIRIEFCGYVKKGDDLTIRNASKPLSQSANTAEEAKGFLQILLLRGSIKDGAEDSVSDKAGYKISGYSYTESKSTINRRRYYRLEFGLRRQ